MAATQFDLTKWVGSLGLDGDNAKAVIAAMSDEKVLNNVKGQVMAQSDYSRAMDELRTQQAQAQRDFDAKYQKEMDELSRYRGEYDSRYEKAAKERLEAQNALNAARAAVEKLANDYALPADAITGIFSSVQPTTQQTTQTQQQRTDPAIDTSKFLTVDNFKREADAYARLTPLLLSLEREHSRLFGADQFPDFEKLLNAHAAGGGKQSLRAIWESEYKVPEKRAELQEADIKARIAAAEEAREKAVRSQIAAENPGAVTTRLKLPGSPALAAAGAPGRTDSTTNATEPAFRRATAGTSEERVSSAVAAFESNLQTALEGSSH